ncbi:MAG TPA: UDP-N-acetylmuramoyl-L-alanyl-D-glutamate--2,6-diaminopimelate ligase [Gallionella sp.]|nr:UDP-N-acetylmuramoyl-L-alanyl-D-glutamate--2,6-diaminopimelate ligase [Gallionella sp.]
MTFSPELLAKLNVPITRLVTDSRAVRHGDTFVAYPGEKTDGRQFIGQAIAQGANAVIWEEQHFTWNDAWHIPNLAVRDLRHKAGWLADAVYGAPSGKLRMVGITGTNGKTSTSHWIAHALNDAGQKCALIGTLGNGFIDALQPTANTTPDAIRVHSLLAGYLQDGARAVAMEVSSHALAQGRVNGVRFDVALLTNLSRDHLDYHGDMQSYAACKRKLFDWEHLKYAVLNLDDAFGVELAEQLQNPDVEIIGYGMSEAALQLAERLGMRMVYGHLVEMSGQGLQLRLHTSWGGGRLRSPLIGRFNAANLLGALAVLLVCDIKLGDAVESLGKVQAVAGRMQRVSDAHQPTVVVDYAHTPDALEKVLVTLRGVSAGAQVSAHEGAEADLQETVTLASRKLICVFGCGGDRDRGKRAMMGLVAEKFADYCIVTSDNPRSEKPEDIIADVVGGMGGTNHEIVEDRAAAIQRAIALARHGDTVLLAGKGHEDYQEINGVKHPFSDVAVAQQALHMWSELQPGQHREEHA